MYLLTVFGVGDRLLHNAPAFNHTPTPATTELRGVWLVVVGILLGVLQWFVLKQHVKRASTWIFASAIAWAIGLGVGWVVGGVLRLATRLFLGELIGLASV